MGPRKKCNTNIYLLHTHTYVSHDWYRTGAWYGTSSHDHCQPLPQKMKYLLGDNDSSDCDIPPKKSKSKKECNHIQEEEVRSDSDSQRQQSKVTYKRVMCMKCQRPQCTCICSTLPSGAPISLDRCRVIVLQHPHEMKKKNRSLPIIELCLKHRRKKSQENEESSYEGENWAIDVTIGRRLGDQVDPPIRSLLQETHNVLLLYPFRSDVKTLSEGVEELRKRRLGRRNGNSKNATPECEVTTPTTTNAAKSQQKSDTDDKITLVFIDATWKYAKEMVQANDTMNLWPPDLVRVKLSPRCLNYNAPNHGKNKRSSSNSCINRNQHRKKSAYIASEAMKSTLTFTTSSTLAEKAEDDESALKSNRDPILPEGYKPRRFDIRTPPSENHLSTAECIAWVVSYIENNPTLYTDIMKPLDSMVSQWHFFMQQDKQQTGL